VHLLSKLFLHQLKDRPIVLMIACMFLPVWVR